MVADRQGTIRGTDGWRPQAATSASEGLVLWLSGEWSRQARRTRDVKRKGSYKTASLTHLLRTPSILLLSSRESEITSGIYYCCCATWLVPCACACGDGEGACRTRASRHVARLEVQLCRPCSLSSSSTELLLQSGRLCVVVSHDRCRIHISMYVTPAPVPLSRSSDWPQPIGQSNNGL
eukprot:scaffold106401_cov33-Tisochrysis_lutea.AAC.4